MSLFFCFFVLKSDVLVLLYFRDDVGFGDREIE